MLNNRKRRYVCARGLWLYGHDRVTEKEKNTTGVCTFDDRRCVTLDGRGQTVVGRRR